MYRRSLVTMFAAVFMGFAAVSPVIAQEDEPEPGLTAAAELPAATVFGEGWVQQDVISPDAIASTSFTMSPDVFREGAVGLYAGAEGSHALVVRFLLTENRVAIRGSWEAANELLDYMTVFETTDYERDRELETMSPPEGCLEATRKEGAARIFRTPYGATLCAADDDSLFLVVIYGPANGATGVPASDAVITTIVGS